MYPYKHKRLMKRRVRSPGIADAQHLCNYAVETNNFGLLVPFLMKCKWTQKVAVFRHLFSVVQKNKVQYAVNLFDEFVTDGNWVYVYVMLQDQRAMYSRLDMEEEASEVSARIRNTLSPFGKKSMVEKIF
jgi:hypothetical protein